MPEGPAPEATTPPPPETGKKGPESAPTPEIRAARKQEAGILSEKLFRQAVPEYPTEEESSESPLTRVISSSESFGRLDTDEIGDGIDFRVDLTVEGTKYHATRIIGVEEPQPGPDGTIPEGAQSKLICEYKSEDGAIIDTVAVDRRDIVKANFVAEKAKILDGYNSDPAAQEVVRTYLDSIDPDVQEDKIVLPSDETIKKVAESHDMMTMDDARAVADLVASGDTAVQNKLKTMDGRLVLGDDELLGLGMSAQDIQDKSTKLGETITALEQKILKEGDEGYDEHYNDEEQITASREFHEAQDQRTLLRNTRRKVVAAQAAKAAATAGTDPTDTTMDWDPDMAEMGPEKRTLIQRNIDQQLTYLNAIIGTDAEPSGYDKTVVNHARRVRAELNLARLAQGEDAAFSQYRAFLLAQEAYKNELSVTGPVPDGITQTLKIPDFLNDAKRAADDIQSTLGLSKDDVKAMGVDLLAPGGLEKIMAQKPELAAKEQELMDKIFGPADIVDRHAVIDDLQKAHLDIQDSKWQNRLMEFIKKDPKNRLGILAIILASLPVVVAGITAAAAVGAVGTVAGGKR